MGMRLPQDRNGRDIAIGTHGGLQEKAMGGICMDYGEAVGYSVEMLRYAKVLKVFHGLISRNGLAKCACACAREAGLGNQLDLFLAWDGSALYGHCETFPANWVVNKLISRSPESW
ncbi:hypothetical protein Pyn_14437 [Prunus yedoensis var. nudiflora]|uniref:Uncharacterized protein n=1 Tax=Prunus yedoensis var. nudiflora TaxID=2094558 RepID=A0A314XI86_PRUYE|nr:hypothetical protein Pyn_14437 [Prunus yedoensis var. nudiflora]